MIHKTLLTTAMCLTVAACGKQNPATFNAYGVSKGAGSTGVHTVLQGDTVYSISKNYQLPMREIITLNNIQAPYILNTGYRMKLPPPNEYKVHAGDTVQGIARLYEVSPNRLASLNGLSAPYHLDVGQVVRLPTPSQRYEEARLASRSNEARNDVSSKVQNRPMQTPWVSTQERQVLDSSAAGAENFVTPGVKPTPPKVQTSSVSRAKVPDVPKMSGEKFMRPVEGRVISTYGAKKDGLHNDGINIKAARGAPVRAAQNGVVVYNGDDLEGYGNLVLVRHENKMMSAYAHLDKTLIKRGAKVVKGQSIGTVGKTGQVDTPQLHFEIRKGSTPLNPNKYL